MKNEKNTKSYIEYLLVRAMLGGLGSLPKPLSVGIGLGLGRLSYHLLPHLRRTGEINLKIAYPDKSDEERREILKGCYESLGRLLGEFSHFPHIKADELEKFVVNDGEDNYRAAERLGRGMIFLTSHLGPWELSSFAHSAFGTPHSFVVRPLDNPYLEDYVERIRGRFGNRPIDKRGALKVALRTLRDGGAVGILADLNSQPHEGVFVPFFGRPACTTIGVALLALKSEAPVLPIFVRWDKSRKKFILRCEPALKLIRTGDNKQDVLENTAMFTSVIERHIRSHPEQWLWVHKRWKSCAEGYSDPY
jgi:Kdo2-lipid IVA lauroyltransferase/acyltransferase